jgi:hypothetical protein
MDCMQCRSRLLEDASFALEKEFQRKAINSGESTPNGSNPILLNSQEQIGEYLRNANSSQLVDSPHARALDAVA